MDDEDEEGENEYLQFSSSNIKGWKEEIKWIKVVKEDFS